MHVVKLLHSYVTEIASQNFDEETGKYFQKQLHFKKLFSELAPRYAERRRNWIYSYP